MLVEMDGFESNEGVILIAATTGPTSSIPRCCARVVSTAAWSSTNPISRAAKRILKVHMRKTPLSADVNTEKIARVTPGFSGADLENLVNEAALQAARENKTRLEMDDSNAPRTKSSWAPSANRWSSATKTSGIPPTTSRSRHRRRMLPGLDPIHKVTIIPRGMALGLTQTLPEEDALNLSKSKATNMIAFMFGGRAAEECRVSRLHDRRRQRHRTRHRPGPPHGLRVGG